MQLLSPSLSPPLPLSVCLSLSLSLPPPSLSVFLSPSLSLSLFYCPLTGIMGGSGCYGEKKPPHQPQGLLIKSNMFSHFFGNLITQNAYLGATGGNKLRRIKNVLRSSKHNYVNAYYPINVHQHRASAHQCKQEAYTYHHLITCLMTD